VAETEIQRALRHVDHIAEPAEQWAAARQLVKRYRDQRNGADGPRTWNETVDVQPSGVVKVYDLDGDVWERGPEPNMTGAWKMRDYNPDEYEEAAGGWYVWSALVERYGPLTEIRED